MSSFLLSALQHSSYSYIPPLPLSHSELVRCLLYHPPSSPPRSCLTSSLFNSPRCACACLCFILSPQSPGLIVILSSSLLPLWYTFYSLVLCPLYLFHTTHRMFPFSLQNPALLIFASLHTLPLCLFRLTGGVHTVRVSFSLSPSPSPRNLLRPHTQSTTHTTPYRSFVMFFLSDVLSLLLFRTQLIFSYTASSAYFPFAVAPRVSLTPASHSLVFISFSVFGTHYKHNINVLLSTTFPQWGPCSRFQYPHPLPT
jgi:hypothetical protein